MFVFQIEKIKKLNETEFQIYNYLTDHITDVSQMTIREFAQLTHVSTATIVRFCRHLGFTGFSELKFYIMQPNQVETSLESYYANFLQLNAFLKGLTGDAFQEKLSQACQMIEASHYTTFMGIGTSGALAAYGYRYFNNVGIQSFVITDPYLPIPRDSYQQSCMIVLSVSGETSEVIEQLDRFKKNGAKIISITNDDASTISKMSDFNFSYYMLDEFAHTTDIKLTTQLPVLALLEVMAHHVKTESINQSKKLSSI
ncbi:putative Phosphosugar-binding transcriptional regulator [Pseudolactococcus piscium]|nr:MurR/RpiR family transcriptional regulator [Lactococcus paracarnosus]SPC37258.1 putative Phosphosugar-binding transcriptional regulator [Lactococcus piscium]